MVAKIYKNYDVLGVGTMYSTVRADIYDEVMVNIPDDIIHGKNEYGDILIDVDGDVYLFRELLTGREHPLIVIPRTNRHIRLNVVG